LRLWTWVLVFILASLCLSYPFWKEKLSSQEREGCKSCRARSRFTR